MIYFKKCNIRMPHPHYKKCACNGIVLDKDFWIRFYDRWHYVIGGILILIGWWILLSDTSF